jgi:putative endonuclease
MLNRKVFYTYILTNRWQTVLYVGMTNNLERRTFEHKNKLIDGFAKKYNADRLVYYEPTNDVRVAIAREKQIKSWSRAKKITLIEAMNAEWIDLASEWFSELQ